MEDIVDMRLPPERATSHRVKEFLKWAGTFLFAIGSILISASPQAATDIMPFAGFCVGHTLWLVAGILMRDKSIIGLNAMYLPFDFYAILIRI